MPAGTLLEGAAHAREVPDVFFGRETPSQILRAENPCVVGKPAAFFGPRVGVDKLPRRWNLDGVGIERERLQVLDEMKQVRVATTELFRAVDAESVVPDHPAAAAKAQVLKRDLQFGREIIADRQPERSIRPEH